MGVGSWKFFQPSYFFGCVPRQRFCSSAGSLRPLQVLVHRRSLRSRPRLLRAFRYHRSHGLEIIMKKITKKEKNFEILYESCKIKNSAPTERNNWNHCNNCINCTSLNTFFPPLYKPPANLPAFSKTYPVHNTHHCAECKRCNFSRTESAE